jgi:hypothetical protein
MKFAKRTFLLLFTSAQLSGQSIPVKFNHLYLVIDSVSMNVIRNSDYVKNILTAFETRTTVADSGRSWTGTYMYGTDNYIELFDSVSSGMGLPAGVSGVAFSVDRVDELKSLNGILSKSHKLEENVRERDFAGKKIPWFNMLNIADSSFYNQSWFDFWLMAYRKEYFDYKKINYKNDILNGASYLREQEKYRKGKIIKRFSGVVMRLSDYEKNFLVAYFKRFGYNKISENEFLTADNFRFTLKPRAEGTNNTIERITFDKEKDTNQGNVKLSENILIKFTTNSGEIVFNNPRN